MVAVRLPLTAWCARACASALSRAACLACIICADVTFSVLLRLLGPVLVCLANGLIGLVVYVYLWLLVPKFVLPALGTAATALVVAVGLFLLFNILFNYWACVCTRPGFPGAQLPPLEDLEAGTDFTDFGDGWRTCRKCKTGKPPRTHHCSVCRRCVMKMDHHCPWVNNCVGFYNYKFFCLFLLYCAAGCAYTALTCLFALYVRTNRREHTIVFIFVLTLSVLFALTLFIVWHVYLVATNQTTIEFYSNRMDASDARRRGERWVNPFSIGARGNFEQVFGMSRNVGLWLLPSRKPPPGDGMDFPMSPDLVPEPAREVDRWV